MKSEYTFKKQDGTTPGGIFYRVTQSAQSEDPLVLVYGYGGNMGMWPVQMIERLAEKFVVVVLDNRGVGRSICPNIPREYTVEVMADDVDAVVSALNLSKFNLLGYSLGGCIALQYSHKYQHKVKSLFLMSTTAGGSLWSPPPQDVGAVLSNPQGEDLWDLYVSVWKTTMGEETLRKHETALRELFENSKDYITPNHALEGHLHAFKSFDSTAFLRDIKFPTTILAGKTDRLIPFQNSINMAEHLPQAKFVGVDHCEHYPQIEEPELMLTEIFNLCGATGR